MADTKDIKISMGDIAQLAMESAAMTIRTTMGGEPGIASGFTTKAKSKTAQLTVNITGSSKIKRSIESIARRTLLRELYQKRAVEFEVLIRRALFNLVAGVTDSDAASHSVSIAGSQVGVAKASRRIETEPFARFILTKEGAGEIGLPDPNHSLDELKDALFHAITPDVIVLNKGPQIKFKFDQSRLLRLTPHPGRDSKQGPAPFFSWLELVTGPNFQRSGTPGFTLVRVGDIRQQARNLRGNGEAGRSSEKSFRKQIRSLTNVIHGSRTLSYSGNAAGLMFLTTSFDKARGQGEFFGGQATDWRPSASFEGFWDVWWARTKADLLQWSHRILRVVHRVMLQRIKGG